MDVVLKLYYEKIFDNGDKSRANGEGYGTSM
jgi:hypothetical protein